MSLKSCDDLLLVPEKIGAVIVVSYRHCYLRHCWVLICERSLITEVADTIKIIYSNEECIELLNLVFFPALSGVLTSVDPE